MWGRRNSEATQRFNERRQREDSAPRLAASVPTLETLTLNIRETTTSSDSSSPEAAHVRRIVVAHAPALFLVTCHDSHCKDGGHDITHDVLLALRQEKSRFTGESRCSGRLGSAECQRIMHYVGTATYRPADQK